MLCSCFSYVTANDITILYVTCLRPKLKTLCIQTNMNIQRNIMFVYIHFIFFSLNVWVQLTWYLLYTWLTDIVGKRTDSGINKRSPNDCVICVPYSTRLVLKNATWYQQLGSRQVEYDPYTIQLWFSFYIMVVNIPMVLAKYTWSNKHTTLPESLPHGQVVCLYIPHDTYKMPDMTYCTCLYLWQFNIH